MGRGRYAWVRDEARNALTLSGATGPRDIDAVRAAKALDIDVTFGGVDGATERITMIGGRARIRVSDRIVLNGRRQFTIAHAIAHKACGHLIAADGDVNAWIAAACSGRTKNDEREADVFATELLAPGAWVRPYCAPSYVDLNAVDAIARAFPVSPVMAAMRFVELTPLTCAVVYAENRVVQWARGSRSFPRLLPRDMAVPDASIAREFFDRRVANVPSRPGRARDWLPNASRIHDRTEIIENAMRIPEPEWGGVLSLLWIPEFPAAMPAVTDALIQSTTSEIDEKIASPM